MKSSLVPPSHLALQSTIIAARDFYPVTEEGILHTAVLADFVRRLEEKESDLLDERQHQEEALRHLAEGHGDDVDRSALQIREEAVAHLNHVRQELPKVQMALTRARNDLKGPKRDARLAPFGKCLEKDCHDFIEKGRLDAVPTAPTCISHTRGCGCMNDGKSHRN
jgi:RNA polymerase-binding transcription factor DksA